MKPIANTLDLLNHAIGFLTKHPTVSERVNQTFGQPISIAKKFIELRDKITKEAEEARTVLVKLDTGEKRFRELREEIKQDAEDLEDIVSVIARRENIDIPAPVFHSGAKFLPELEQYLAELKPFQAKLQEIDPYKLHSKIKESYQELKGLLDQTGQDEQKVDQEVKESDKALSEARKQWKVLYGALKETVRAYFPELKSELTKKRSSNSTSKSGNESSDGSIS